MGGVWAGTGMERGWKIILEYLARSGNVSWAGDAVSNNCVPSMPTSP